MKGLRLPLIRVGPGLQRHRLMAVHIGVALTCSLVPVAVHSQPSQPPGHALERGMQLVYGSGGQEQPAWSVDSINLRAQFGGQVNCSVIRFGANDLRRLCVRGDTLFTWNEVAQTLVPSRPLGPAMSMRVRGTAGRTLVYETGARGASTISGMPIDFVHTTVATVDSTGQTIRRLRERYALSLATALDGTFEVPSAESGGGWKTEREFSLVRVARAAR